MPAISIGNILALLRGTILKFEVVNISVERTISSKKELRQVFRMGIFKIFLKTDLVNPT